VEKSRWVTRGWTYQAALFSKRRLVFTDEQAYFDCHGMSCYEKFKPPLEVIHVEDVGRITESPQWTLNQMRIIPTEPVGHLRDIFTRIMRYSGRLTKYQEDRLYAFLGVLDVFETGPFQIRNHWGTPIFARTLFSTTPKQSERNRGYLSTRIVPASPLLCVVSPS
jgi:hypothetical protein